VSFASHFYCSCSFSAICSRVSSCDFTVFEGLLIFWSFVYHKCLSFLATQILCLFCIDWLGSKTLWRVTDPGLIHYENRMQLLISSGHLLPHIGRHACHCNNNTSLAACEGTNSVQDCHRDARYSKSTWGSISQQYHQIQHRRIWTSPAPFLYNQRSCCHDDTDPVREARLHRLRSKYLEPDSCSHQQPSFCPDFSQSSKNLFVFRDHLDTVVHYRSHCCR